MPFDRSAANDRSLAQASRGASPDVQKKTDDDGGVLPPIGRNGLLSMLASGPVVQYRLETFLDGPVQLAQTGSGSGSGSGSGGSNATIKLEARKTLSGDAYKKFQKNLADYATKIKLTLDASEVEKIWLTVVEKLIEIKDEFKKVPVTDKEKGYRKLSDQTYKDLSADVATVCTAFDTLFDAFVDGKTKWAFWSGGGAKDAAINSGIAEIALEATAFGKPFNKVGDIAGAQDIVLWGALSTAYATRAAEEIQGKSYYGFVGPGAGRSESVFNQVEQPTFNDLCKKKHGVVPQITWHAVANGLDDWDKWDTSYKDGAQPGIIAIDTNRSRCVELAQLVREQREDAKETASRSGTPREVQGQGEIQHSGGDGAAVRETAAAGVSGSGGALPHGDKIQQSFGSYDLSGVKAHVGGKAAEASQSMGASAYATGNDVAFKSSPDLHTAAHEAAHVIQQRQGVSLAGGVGQPGDKYEKHADSVADAVVSGKSAEPLLTGGPGGGPSLQSLAEVQFAGGRSDGETRHRTPVSGPSTIELSAQKTLEKEPYKNFKKNLEDHAKACGVELNEDDIKAIWLTVVRKLLEINEAFKKVPLADEEKGYVQLSSDAYKELAADVAAVGKAFDTLFDTFIDGKSKWAFWSGGGAKDCALNSGIAEIVLEATAFGKPFNEIGTIAGTQDIVLWGALSAAYAKKAAAEIEGKQYFGFVGCGGGRAESIFNQVEQPTFRDLCLKDHGVVPPITWHGVVNDLTNWDAWDKAWTRGPSPGIAYVGGDRGAALKAAEDVRAWRENPTPLPEATYTEVGGEEHTLSLEVKEGKATAKRHSSSPGPVSGASDSQHPFDIAKRIEDLTAEYVRTGNEALLDQITAEMTDLREAMAKARGENIPLVQLRTKYEKELGEHAYAGSFSNFGMGAAAVNTMCQKAIALMGTYYDQTIDATTPIDQVFTTLSSNDEFKAQIESMGIPTNLGFAGAVGNAFADIQAVFTGGSLTEKCVHLGNFGSKVLTPMAVAGYKSPTDPDYMRVMQQIKTNVEGFAAGEYDKFLARCATAESTGKGHKVLLTEFHVSPDYEEGKASPEGDMDRKTPYVPIETLELEELCFLAKRVNVDISQCKNQAEIIDALKAEGWKYSGAVKDADYFHPDVKKQKKGGGGAGSITREGEVFLEGIRDNIVKPDHSWIETANQLKMPLKAGISGTTHRFMSLAKTLGAEPGSGPRLAMLGHLQKIEAHSFHEIMIAASGFSDCAYTPGSYVPFSPIPDEDMKSIAKDVLKADPDFAKDVTGTNDLDLQAERLMKNPGT